MNTAASSQTRESTKAAAAAYYDRSFWDRAEERAVAKQAKRRAETPLAEARLAVLSDSFGEGYPL